MTALPPPVDRTIEILKHQNREWVHKVDKSDPTFFKRTAENQEPKALWIGCSDSRVPESVVLGCMPGVIFTHRNIANQVFADDPNGVSAITYAVLELGVEHIIVSGHSRCGGVAVCLDSHLTTRDIAECFEASQKSSWPPPAPIDEWLTPLKELADSYPHPPSVQQLVEANVRKQVEKVLSLPVVQSAWVATGGKLKGVHGWWYELETGYVHDLEISVYGPGKVQQY